MSKKLSPLEALEKIRKEIAYYSLYEKHLDTIETALTAFEIIKSKQMLSVFKAVNGKCFIVFNTTAIEIPQEEYDLLKEMLF